jgi:anti-sigma factor RsiW
MCEAHCDQLDDYLDGELDAAAHRRFETHVAACGACRQAVAQAAHLDQLLAKARPVAPPGLTDRIALRIRRERNTRLAMRSGLLVAASLLIALGIWSQRGENPVAPGDAPQVAVTPAPQVRIEFPDDAPVIVMPLKSKNPKVSIVWVYPTVDAPSSIDNEVKPN